MRPALAVLAAALLAACQGERVAVPPTPTPNRTPVVTVSPTASPSTTPRPTVSPTPSARPAATAAGVPSCPSYQDPDPHRPVLTADVTVNGRDVRGTERFVFTPDLAVGQLVLRLWASAPVPARSGSRSAVTSVAVNGVERSFSRPSPTLVRVPFSGRAGEALTIDVGFTLTLPVGADERWGSRGTTSWFASGMPLLAWERGRGWATEPPTTQFAEASTSEEMRLERLTVHHARGLTVLATGATLARNATTLVTSAPAVRDVAVAVGAFRIAEARGPVPVTVGVAPGLTDSATSLAQQTVSHLRRHVARFGPFPYQHVVIAVLPDIRGGIEYPGAILLGTRQDRDATLSHELAHQWFYGLVGNDQGRDPWIDEAFATYAEALDRGTASRYAGARFSAAIRGRTGEPMSWWEGRSGYYQGVYVQGAQALLRARAKDPRLFDAQVRCFVAHNAHRIATPADVARDLTLALPELRRAGAL